MDNVTVLTIVIETRPQYGETETILVGVFDNPEILKTAKDQYKHKEEHKWCRYIFKEKKVELNAIPL